MRDPPGRCAHYLGNFGSLAVVTLAAALASSACDSSRPTATVQGTGGGGDSGAAATAGTGAVAGSAGGPGSAGGAGAGGSAGDAGAGTDHHPLVDFLGDPDYPDDFWTAATAEEADVDADALQAAVDWIDSSDWEFHSFLVAYQGRLVLEQYGWKSGRNPDDPDTAHQILPSERHLQWSCTKSVLSALVGIALADGAISSIDTPVVDWFPDYETLNPSPEKSTITLEDLLTMRSGLQWEEGDQTTFEAPDPARAMLARPVVDTPVGEVWNYSTGGSDIIAEVLRVATGMTPLGYAQDRLFGPLGIVNPPWAAGQNGTQHGGWGLSLTSREMARFGELYRNSGVWDSAQIVPADWVQTSTTSHTETAWWRDYGYHWWVSNLPGGFNAFGMYGQEIFIDPERELVVVFTGDLPSDQAETIFEGLIRDYVLPALG